MWWVATRSSGEFFTSGSVHANVGRHGRALWGGWRLRRPARRSVAGAGEDEAEHLVERGSMGESLSSNGMKRN